MRVHQLSPFAIPLDMGVWLRELEAEIDDWEHWNHGFRDNVYEADLKAAHHFRVIDETDLESLEFGAAIDYSQFHAMCLVVCHVPKSQNDAVCI